MRARHFHSYPRPDLYSYQVCLCNAHTYAGSSYSYLYTPYLYTYSRAADAYTGSTGGTNPYRGTGTTNAYPYRDTGTANAYPYRNTGTSTTSFCHRHYDRDSSRSLCHGQ